MKEPVFEKPEIRWMVARNAWSASHIMKRIHRGQASPDLHLVASEQDAINRRSKFRPMQQPLYGIFKVHYFPNGVK